MGLASLMVIGVDWYNQQLHLSVTLSVYILVTKPATYSDDGGQR